MNAVVLPVRPAQRPNLVDFLDAALEAILHPRRAWLRRRFRRGGSRHTEALLSDSTVHVVDVAPDRWQDGWHLRNYGVVMTSQIHELARAGVFSGHRDW